MVADSYGHEIVTDRWRSLIIVGDAPAVEDRLEDVDHPQLQAVVADREAAADEQLPNTGVSRELERLLSAQFIVSEAYGTRATTSLWLDASGGFSRQESNYLRGGIFDASADCRFSPDARG